MPSCGEAMHMRNMGMSFFVVCPLRNCECKAPKIGMNCNQSLKILFPFDSSRFSGQLSRIYKGIPKKDISMFHAKKDISVLPWSPTGKPMVPQNHTHLRQGFGGSSAGERNPPKHDRLIAEMVYHSLTHPSTAKAVVSYVGG